MIWIAIAVAALVCVAPMLHRYASERSLRRECARRGVLVLTFDDGPGPATTPRLLDALASGGVRASFFALGSRALAAPGVLDRAAAEGHEIGSHSFEHAHAWKCAPWTSAADAIRGARALAPWTPRRPLFRPPYGKLTPITWAVTRLAGTRFGWWTHDSGDTWESLPDPESVVDRVRESRGGIVLLHDFDREDARTNYVVDLTARLVRTARTDGLRVVPLRDLLDEIERGPPARCA